MKSFDVKQALLSSVKYLVLFLVPKLVDMFLVAYPEWAQLTVGGVLVFFVKWLKVSKGLKLP